MAHTSYMPAFKNKILALIGLQHAGIFSYPGVAPMYLFKYVYLGRPIDMCPLIGHSHQPGYPCTSALSLMHLKGDRFRLRLLFYWRDGIFDCAWCLVIRGSSWAARKDCSKANDAFCCSSMSIIHPLLHTYKQCQSLSRH